MSVRDELTRDHERLDALLATMIGYAQARYREKRRSTFTFSSSLLSGNALLGPKTGEA